MKFKIDSLMKMLMPLLKLLKDLLPKSLVDNLNLLLTDMPEKLEKKLPI